MSDPGDNRSPGFQAAYPDALLAGEQALLGARRKAADLPWSTDRLIGVGVSGGGIRSATFALGLFQGMARKGLVRWIDYLSTVSGGGYFGSFFGRLLTREYVQTPEDVEEILQGKRQPQVVGFLRENGRYLSPNGAGDSLLAGSAVLRNLISIHIVLSTFVRRCFSACRACAVWRTN
ncbi:MAG TPA: hypothetical protein VGX68_08805 [Thermoanaerobaculia bacterium]|jgi:hypothetical protein|nr:hypothetical protein [Thermoanaerobaculia bacterium]